MRKSIKLKNEFIYLSKDRIRLSRKAGLSWIEIVNAIDEEVSKDHVIMLKKRWLLQAVADVAQEEKVRDIAIGNNKPNISLPKALLNIINNLNK